MWYYKSKDSLCIIFRHDTVLPENFFKILEINVKKITNFAIIAPKTNDIYDESSLNKRGNLNLFQFLYNKLFFKAKLEKNEYPNIIQQFFVSGSIMLIDKENTYEEDILFDENIFLYFEENDFSSMSQKGKKIYLINNHEAYHWEVLLMISHKNNALKMALEWSKYYFLINIIIIDYFFYCSDFCY